MATLRETFSDIADAIRAKGISGTMTPLEMSTKIASIPSGGGTVYGMTVQNIIGDVDQNGALVPTSSFSFSSNDITAVGNMLYYKFYDNTAITQFLLPKVTTLDTLNALYAVCQKATNLTKVDLSGLTSITGNQVLYNAFRGCTSLVEVDLSSLTTMAMVAQNAFWYTFQGCTALKRVYLTKYSSSSGFQPWSQTFAGCTALELVDYSEATAVPALTSTNVFNNTNETFKIVVPDDLYSTWTTASNWSSFSSHIVKVSEYTPAS